MKRKLTIDISVQNQRVVAVSTRLPKFNATALLAGQHAQDAVSKLAMVLSICRQAQSIAALTAMAAAQHQELPEPVLELCQVSVMIENLQESVRAFCFSLPTDLRPDSLMADFSPVWRKSLLLLFQLSLALQKNQIPEQKKMRQDVRNLILLWDAFCHQYIHGISPKIWEAQNWEVNSNSAISTPAIEWCKLLAKEVPELGRLNLQPLPVSEIHAGKLTWAESINQPYDATSWRRVMSEPQMTNLITQCGNSVVARLSGRFLEITKTIKTLIQFSESTTPVKHLNGVHAYTLADDSGVSEIECARGLLVHQVELDKTQIKTYKVYAPTDWNLHPEGALSTLIRHDASDLERLRKHATWLVQVLDPCVEYEINIVKI